MKNRLANPLVKTRYENSENLARVEQRVVDFFCAGIPEPQTCSEVLAILWSLKGEVIRV